MATIPFVNMHTALIIRPRCACQVCADGTARKGVAACSVPAGVEITAAGFMKFMNTQSTPVSAHENGARALSTPTKPVLILDLLSLLCTLRH